MECFFCFMSMLWSLMWWGAVGGATWWCATQYNKNMLGPSLRIMYSRASRYAYVLYERFILKKKPFNGDPNEPSPDSESENETNEGTNDPQKYSSSPEPDMDDVASTAASAAGGAAAAATTTSDLDKLD